MKHSVQSAQSNVPIRKYTNVYICTEFVLFKQEHKSCYAQHLDEVSIKNVYSNLNV